MKKFSFALDRVLDFRSQVEEAERSRLNALAAQRVRLLEEAQEKRRQSRAARLALLSRSTFPAADLKYAHDYAGSLERSREETLGRAEQVEQRRREQREIVIEARRKKRLLEILRARKLARYSKAAGREQENLIADLHLAKLNRESADFAPPSLKKSSKFAAVAR
jgi:flagellar export protein FliJ